MEVVTCKGCGRLFNHIGGERVCPACKKKLEERFTEVKKYVRENPDVEIHTLSKEMDVSVAQIKRWVREERLVFSEDSPVGIPCESCGKTIKTGRYCEMCKTKIGNELRSAAGLSEQKKKEREIRRSSESKMRFLDN